MNFKSVEDYLSLKIDELKFPYLNVLVKENGKEIFAFQKSSFDKNRNTLAMYSMTKVITAVAFMQLVEKGLVNPDDLVSKYLDGFDDLYLFSGVKIKTQLTIKHLLTMTGGLDYDLNRNSIKKMIISNPDVKGFELCSSFAKDGLLFEPGTRFNYSLCLDVVGGIIEKVSGLSLADYVEKNIFIPLKMENSTLRYDEANYLATIPEFASDGKKLVETERYYNLVKIAKNYFSGGSSLISTVKDFSKFTDALVKGQLISDKSIDLMATPYIKDTPFSKELGEYSKSNEEYGYGFGVRVRKVSKHNIPVGEFGWDGATGSYCLCDPENKISIVVGMTIHGWPDYIKDFHIRLSEKIYDCIFMQK